MRIPSVSSIQIMDISVRSEINNGMQSILEKCTSQILIKECPPFNSVH